MAGEDVVIFDIDGDPGHVRGRRSARPQALAAAGLAGVFARIGEATVFEAGRDLVAATAALGFTVIYSTTRPDFTASGTRQWLAETGLPPAAAAFSRPNKQGGRPTLDIKLHHG